MVVVVHPPVVVASELVLSFGWHKSNSLSYMQLSIQSFFLSSPNLTRDCFSLRVRDRGSVWVFAVPDSHFLWKQKTLPPWWHLVQGGSVLYLYLRIFVSALYFYLCIFVFIIAAITLGRVMPCLCLGEYCGIILGIICTEHERQHLPIVHCSIFQPNLAQ